MEEKEKEFFEIVDYVMIFVTLLNLGFNAKFVLEEEDKDILNYLQIVMLVEVLDLLNLDLVLEDLPMELMVQVLLLEWYHLCIHLQFNQVLEQHLMVQDFHQLIIKDIF